MSGENALPRPERIARILLRVVEHRSIATREVRTLLGCSKRIAESDLKLLAEQRTLKRTGAGRHQRYVLADEALPLVVEDQVSLLVGREVTRFLGTTPWMEHVDVPLLKGRVRYLPEPSREYGPKAELVRELLRAVTNDLVLDLVYETRRGPEQWRYEPYSLLVYRRGLYLVGRLGKKLYTLSVDRIARATAGEPFPRPPDWDVDRWLGSRFGITSGERDEPDEVVIRFSRAVATLVQERRWHSNQTIRVLPNGDVELRFHASGRELVRFALEWGDHAEVLAPAWLREKVRERLTSALERYASKVPEQPSTGPADRD